MGLIDEYRTMHSLGHFQGFSVLKFSPEIEALCKKHKAKTMLDYGAGQGYQYAPPHCLQEKWNVDITCYDPAVHGMEMLPSGPFDAVIATDLLEHIPIAEIPTTLHEIFCRATKFVFLSVCCRASKKKLPNGDPVHCTLLPLDKWWSEIDTVAAGYNVEWVVRETE